MGAQSKSIAVLWQLLKGRIFVYSLKMSFLNDTKVSLLLQ